MGILQKDPVAGDVVMEELSPLHCREEKVIDNTLGLTDLDLKVGYPMDDAVPVVATGEANADGILLVNVKVAAGTKSPKVAVLARGPAVINEDRLPAKDHAGDAFTVATLVAAYAALGIVSRSEPTKTEEQTT